MVRILLISFAISRFTGSLTVVNTSSSYSIVYSNVFTFFIFVLFSTNSLNNWATSSSTSWLRSLKQLFRFVLESSDLNFVLIFSIVLRLVNSAKDSDLSAVIVKAPGSSVDRLSSLFIKLLSAYFGISLIADSKTRLVWTDLLDVYTFSFLLSSSSSIIFAYSSIFEFYFDVMPLEPICAHPIRLVDFLA